MMDRDDIFTADRLERELERAYKDYHACADMAEKMEDENTHLVNELERVKAENERYRKVLTAITNPPLVLSTDDACEVAGWFVHQAKRALEAKP